MNPTTNPQLVDQDLDPQQRLRNLVLADSYPCVMARSVFNRNAYQVRTYGVLGDAANAESLCEDIYEFCNQLPSPLNGAVSFIACFSDPAPMNEADFEDALWQQLQAIHTVDSRRFGWSTAVSSAANDPNFSFSIGGRAFFLIGMHPHASRIARRLPNPAIVFNLHEQFVSLRTTGKFDAVRDKVQARDKQLQGTPNPMMADFGTRSEAAQYSGRQVGPEWVCPFAAET